MGQGSYSKTFTKDFNAAISSGMSRGDALKFASSMVNNTGRSDVFQVSRGDGSSNQVLSYPIKRNNNEKTGDTLKIKCIQYRPPKNGSGLTMKIDNVFNTDGSTITKDQVAALKKANPNDPNAGKPKFTHNFEDTNTRLKSNQIIKYYVELPAPQEINDSNSVTWGDDKLNALQLAGLTVAQQAIAGGGDGAVEMAQSAMAILQRGINIPGLTQDTQNAIKASISGAAINALGANVSAGSILSRSTGQILNSNLELLFQGVNLRTFPFTFTFSPRNSKEADVVKAIIKSLKASMSPKAGDYNGSAQGIFLKSPDLFQLKYLHDGEDHPFLNSFKLCALTGMQENYTNAGTYASYGDGTPVNIRMNLNFKEINPIYHEDYSSDEAGSGVGF